MKPWVVLKTVSDSTGAVTVNAVEIFTGVAAERAARSAAYRLNQTQRKGIWEAYIAREVGSENDEPID